MWTRGTWQGCSPLCSCRGGKRGGRKEVQLCAEGCARAVNRLCVLSLTPFPHPQACTHVVRAPVAGPSAGGRHYHHVCCCGPSRGGGDEHRGRRRGGGEGCGRAGRRPRAVGKFGHSHECVGHVGLEALQRACCWRRAGEGEGGPAGLHYCEYAVHWGGGGVAGGFLRCSGYGSIIALACGEPLRTRRPRDQRLQAA